MIKRMIHDMYDTHEQQVYEVTQQAIHTLAAEIGGSDAIEKASDYIFRYMVDMGHRSYPCSCGHETSDIQGKPVCHYSHNI